MGIDTDFDLNDEFFDTDDFAEAFAVIAADGSAVEINGIFTSADEAVDLGRVGIESEAPMVEIAEGDLEHVQESVRMVRNKTAQAYAVKDIRPDGNGCVMLHLREVD